MTLQWFLHLVTVAVAAVLGTTAFLFLAWLFRPKQGFPRTRRFR